jgi:hypothetical protein
MLTMLARTAQVRNNPTVAAAAAHSNLTFRAATFDETTAASNTFTSQAIGTAASDRWVIITAAVQSSPSGAITCTVGGISATRVATGFQASIGIDAAIFAVNVPTGTTANIVFTSGGTGFRWQFAYWTVNMAVGTTTFTGVNNSGAANSVAISSVLVNANGFAVGMAFESGAGSDIAMSVSAPFVEQAEQFTTSAMNFEYVHVDTVASVNTTVTFTMTGATADGNAAIIASWA